MNRAAVQRMAIRMRKEGIREVGNRAVSFKKEQAVEKTASFWFRRFITLRFMEVNGYLPGKMRLFTNGKGQILSEKEPKTRFLERCKALETEFPWFWERIGHEEELLLPESFWQAEGVLERLVYGLPESEWKQVPVVGWLWQYYQTELKNAAIAQVKKNVKLTPEQIPAATQFFTPEWIVRYLVENSVGQLWRERYPEEKNDGWKYFLPEAPQEAEVAEKLAAIRETYRIETPEAITILDPCVGCGHILIAAMEVLVAIYEKRGIPAREAVSKILRHNLFGLDIDERVVKLAIFAVMMKGREYDSELFTRGIVPRIYTLTNSREIDVKSLESLACGDVSKQEELRRLREEMRNAGEIGSLLTVTPIDFSAYSRRLEKMRKEGCGEAKKFSEKEASFLASAEVLSQKYDVVVTNPPYLARSVMPDSLASFVKTHYPDASSDLYACFMEKGLAMLRPHGCFAVVTMQTWMFLASLEKMRRKILRNQTITHLLQMEYLLMGIAFGTAAAIFRNPSLPRFRGTYHQVHLRDMANEEPREFPVSGNRLAQVPQERFSAIPGSPIAYWVSERLIQTFSEKRFSDYGMAKSGLQTGNNEKYLRFWYEPDFNRIAMGMTDKATFLATGKKWVPQMKGGEYRKWYGNLDYVVNWEHDGEAIRRDSRSRLNAMAQDALFFQPGVTWSHTTSGYFAARYLPVGFLFNVESPAYFSDRLPTYYLLGLLNSCVAQHYLSAMNSTLHYLVGNLLAIPLKTSRQEENAVCRRVAECVALAREEWDSVETSWDFQRPALLPRKKTSDSLLSEHFQHWKKVCDERFSRLKANEEALNRIFLEIYGLQEELSPEVPENQVSVRKADAGREVKGLISYAVGCMLGRYRLDREGLAYAGGTWNADICQIFPPEKEPFLLLGKDGEKIAGRLEAFLETVYGSWTLEANLTFLAEYLPGNGSPREVIRSYFRNHFYTDHCQMYRKRPIYWLLSSGKKKGFQALFSIHRYHPDLLATLVPHVQKQHQAILTQQADLAGILPTVSYQEKAKIRRLQQKLHEQSEEICVWMEKLCPLARQKKTLCLDDGVKQNYALFQDILAKIG